MKAQNNLSQVAITLAAGPTHPVRFYTGQFTGHWPSVAASS